MIRDNKFIFIELYNNKNEHPNLAGVPEVSKKYHDFLRFEILSLESYLVDFDCMYSVLELDNHYYVQLYYFPNKLMLDLDLKHKHRMHISEVFLYFNDCMKGIEIEINNLDDLNIFKHFIHDVNKNPSLDMLGLSRQFVITKELLFKKTQFKKEECEYWIHICLKTFVNFHIENIKYIRYAFVHHYVIPKVSHSPISSSITQSINYYHFKKVFKKANNNYTTFFLEASLEFQLNKTKVLEEVYFKRVFFYNTPD